MKKLILLLCAVVVVVSANAQIIDTTEKYVSSDTIFVEWDTTSLFFFKKQILDMDIKEKPDGTYYNSLNIKLSDAIEKCNYLEQEINYYEYQYFLNSRRRRFSFPIYLKKPHLRFKPFY